MRVLIAPGSYKSTIKSVTATNIVSESLRSVLPMSAIEPLVLADGGEGTIEMFEVHFGLRTERQLVRTPLGGSVAASVGFLKDGSAIIESSQAIGWSLVNAENMNPFAASSYGVGELIKWAVNKGATTVVVTMGDSATMDMGIGMLSALGVKFYSNSGELLTPGLQTMREIVDFDDSGLQSMRERVKFVGLVDTNDYLCGDVGQVRLYGRQKGLKDEDVEHVEGSFFHFSDIIQRHFDVDVTGVLRSTGSGGVAAALHTFLGADLLNTLDYVSKCLNIDSQIRSADLTVTGEGCLDKQTKLGKVPFFVAARSKRCIAIVGKYTQEGLTDMQNVCSQFSIFSLNPELAMSNSEVALREIARSIGSILG